MTSPSVMPRNPRREYLRTTKVCWPIYASAACFALACAGGLAAVVVWRMEK